MTWLEHHVRSEKLAAEAEVAARSGDVSRSRSLYAMAAQAEEQALADTDLAKTRTLGISAVSTVSLYYKAAQVDAAERIAYRWLSYANLPGFAADQLRELLRFIWSEQVRQRADVGFAPGQVLVAVKGGEIVEGGAPLDLIVEKVQTVQALFYRTAELLRGLPHRMRGGPDKDVLETCRPWLFQALPGSYQFAVAVQEPRQPSLFGPREPHPQAIIEQFMRVLRACVEDPEAQLPDVVPDASYRNTFLKLTRNLAPTGKRFGQLEVRSAAASRPLSLIPQTRAVLGQAIRAARLAEAPTEEVEETVKGILRAVHLDKDWIEVTVDDAHLRINGVGETVDDVIGPMVNHAVVVRVTRPKRGTLRFHDLELDE